MNFPWKKRDDLIIQPHDTGGWLIKDPISLQYTLLSSLEYQVFQKLDGLTDLRTVVSNLDRLDLTPQDLESFLGHLIKRQLLFRPTGGDAERFSTLKPKAISAFAWLTRLLSWYIPLGNPRSVLTKLQWINQLVFQRQFIHLGMLLFVTAICVVCLNLNQLVTEVSQLASSLTSSSVLSLLAILVAVKLAHELGHALSARHFGTDCHEAGVLLLFLTPVPFTNVTDSWRLPVSERMVVTAAGIIVELFIACSCMILWSLAADGLTKDLLLQTTLICSINTVLFNGNPLLKFDGYFLLSDYLRIPNLSSRASDLLRTICVSFLSGHPIQAGHEKADQKTLVTYGLLACIYRIVLAFSILEAIHLLCSSNDLKTLGWILKALTATALIGLPMTKFLLALISEPSWGMTAETANLRRNARPNNARKSLGRITISLVVLCAIGFFPLPSKVVSIATVTPDQQRVFAAVSGQLSAEAITADRNISPESWRLVRMESRSTLLSLQAELELARLQLQIAQRTHRTQSGPSIQELQEAADSAEFRVTELQQTIQKQVQPISKHGRGFVAVRTFQQDLDATLSESWTGVPLSKQNLGAEIQQGTTLGYLESDQAPVVTTWVLESDIQKIQIGQHARFRLSAGGAESHRAVVNAVSRFPAETLPVSVAISQNLQGQPSDSGFRPDDTYYAVTIQLKGNHHKAVLPFHGVGLAAVQVHNQSLANRFYDYLRRTFVFSSAL